LKSIVSLDYDLMFKIIDSDSTSGWMMLNLFNNKVGHAIFIFRIVLVMTSVNFASYRIKGLVIISILFSCCN